MIETSVGLLLVITLLFAFWTLKSVPVLSFVGFTTGIFCVFVLPKVYLFHQYGSAVFLAQDVGFNSIHVNAAVVSICFFTLGVVVSYYLPINWLRNPTGYLIPNFLIFKNQEKKFIISDNIFLYSVFPIYLISFTGFIWVTYDVGGHVFEKTNYIYNEKISPAYYMQKIVQVVKIGIYLYFLQLVASNIKQLPSRSVLIMSVAVVSTTLIFLVSGHRSGIIILFIQFVFFAQYMGKIRTKHIVIGVCVLVALNIFILMFRESTETTQFYIVNLLRRYFFEIEKISGLMVVLENGGQAINAPWMILGSFAIDLPFEGSPYYFLGHEVLNSKSAVGPTVLGDIILYFGGIFIFPMALILGFSMRIVERITRLSSNPIVVLVGITTLAIGVFLLLNTDTWAFVKRLIFEVGLIFIAFLSLRVYTSIFRREY